MDQNQTVDNDDLQKAIENITNTTNTDPAFSDPVAAPSSIPEGDTGSLGEPIGPFANPGKVEMLPPTPEPIAPLESANIPELNSMPPLEAAPQEAPSEPLQAPNSPEKSGAEKIKADALRDLIPLLDKVEIEPQQKFNICKDAFEDLKDAKALEPAYSAAKEISDEKAKAEALLYLVESIDKM